MEFKTYNVYNGSGEVIRTVEYKIEENRLYIRKDGIEKSWKIKEWTSFSWSFSKTIVKVFHTKEDFEIEIEKMNQFDQTFNRTFGDTMIKALTL